MRRGDDLYEKIQTALSASRTYQMGRHPEINAALDAIAGKTGINREEVMWRAFRVYLVAYLHTHTEDWLKPD